MYRKQRFTIHTRVPGDTGPSEVKGDTGFALNGEVKQIRCVHAADTGALGTLVLTLVPDSDTGMGFEFFNSGAIGLGTQFTRHPRMHVYFEDNIRDTGPAEAVGAGDRLRIKVRPTDTGCYIDGDLYVWTKQ